MSKNIIITGTSSGIGFELVNIFSKKNHRVLALSRDNSKLRELKLDGVDDGLIVPVLKNADKMSVAEISTTVKEMAGLARDKKLTPEMMHGSTFTISNLGMFGIESFTSIINPPNSVILSVGAIIQKPVVKDGEIVIGNTMKLTLACDHRTIDGVTGSLFLQTLKGYLENPVTILV